MWALLTFEESELSKKVGLGQILSYIEPILHLVRIKRLRFVSTISLTITVGSCGIFPVRRIGMDSPGFHRHFEASHCSRGKVITAYVFLKDTHNMLPT
jgi:hypothetical protein